jgi:hypothetical protein
MPFFLVTSKLQIVRGNLKNWEIARFGHASRGKGDTQINVGMRGSLSRKSLYVSLRYVPSKAIESQILARTA